MPGSSSRLSFGPLGSGCYSGCNWKARASRSCPEAMGKVQINWKSHCHVPADASTGTKVEAASSFAVPALQESKSCYSITMMII